MQGVTGDSLRTALEAHGAKSVCKAIEQVWHRRFHSLIAQAGAGAMENRLPPMTPDQAAMIEVAEKAAHDTGLLCATLESRRVLYVSR